MTSTLTVAAGQFAPGEDKEANLTAIIELVQQAAARQVRVLVLPELSMYRRHDSPLSESIANAEPLDGPFITRINELSREHSMLIAVGIYETIPAEVGVTDRVYNTLVVMDHGEIVSAYRKIHLYDAFTAKESDSIHPGDDLAPVLQVDGFNIGFAICYDVRFPELFRTFADRDVDVIALATAWARGVGKEEHWDTLIKARAIENTAYFIASDEVSEKSVGRSKVLDPFGYVLGDAGEQRSALVVAEVSHARIKEVRSILPSLENRRLSVDHSIHQLP